jgi:hypothetical protein
VFDDPDLQPEQLLEHLLQISKSPQLLERPSLEDEHPLIAGVNPQRPERPLDARQAESRLDGR